MKKLSAILVLLFLIAGVCEAGKLPGVAVYDMKGLKSTSNPHGAWTVTAPAKFGGAYVFRGKKGITLNSSKDSPRILREIAKADVCAPIITPDDLAGNVETSLGKTSQINICLAPPASKRFMEYTRTHVGCFLGVYIDGRLVSLARVMEPIRNGRIRITNIGDKKTANEFAIKITQAMHGNCALSSGNTGPDITSLVTPKGKGITQKFGEFAYVETRHKGFTQVYGTIRGSVRWTKAKSPYVVTDNIYVDRDASLTIDPGVTVKFTKKAGSNEYDGRLSLSVSGRLQAEGTPSERITFTSASQNPHDAMDWQDIELNSDQPNILTWAVVRYGGSVWVQGCALVSHCVIEHCHSAIWLRAGAMAEVRNNVCVYGAWSGIRSQDTSQYCLITDNIFWKNGDGVDSWCGGRAYLDHNLVFGNTTDYYQFAVPGTNDVRADPKFVYAGKSDYTLASDSPARKAGTNRTDIGLCEEKWSPKSALAEKQKFLDHGALALFVKALPPACSCGCMPKSSNGIELCEAALRKSTEPLLRDRISCCLADLYRQGKQPEKATTLLNQVIKTSKLAHLRDFARDILAQVYADQKKYQNALEIMGKMEWPQSKTWANAELPRYLAMAGKMDEALAKLRDEPKMECYDYVSSLVAMVDSAVKADRLDAAKAALAGIDRYPLCPQAVEMRLQVAYALRDAKRYDEALALLKENDSKDPFSRNAPENLFAMAAILDDMSKPDEAVQVRIKLLADYYGEDDYVKRAREALKGGVPADDKSKLVLLDESLGERSVFDRYEQGNCNGGQWIGAQALLARGLHVHTNGECRRDALDLKIVERYGLVIMHGRYGASDDPPMPRDTIESLVTYVKNGGVLMVLTCGTQCGSGREAHYYNSLMKQFGMSFAEDTTLPDSRTPARALLPCDNVVEFTPIDGVEVLPGQGSVLARCGAMPIAANARFGKGWVVAVGSGCGFMDGELSGTCDAKRGSMNKDAYVRLVEYALSLRSKDIGK